MKNDDEILKALLTSGSPTAAAKQLGISSTTVLNRLKMPEFAKKYETARGEILQNTVNKMTAALSGAIETLAMIMNDADVPASVRVSAADGILRHSLRYIDAVEFEKRLRAVEERNDNEEFKQSIE